MCTIVCIKSPGCCGFYARGHAGDRAVCNAVSTIFYLLLNHGKRLEEKSGKQLLEYRIGKDEHEIRLLTEAEHQKQRQVSLLCSVARTGFEMLMREYPEQVEFTVKKG